MEKNRIFRRGDIVFVASTSGSCGSEQMGGRPAVVVSNNACNSYSSVIEVVYLTAADKKPLPTHVRIYSCKRRSTALCEQIDSISKDRICRYIGRCSDMEIDEIDKALLVSLTLTVARQHVSNLIGISNQWAMNFSTAIV